MKTQYYLTHEQLHNLPNCKPNWTKAFHYAKLMEDGVKFPPVNIFFNEKRNEWCYNDGRHRVTAAKMSGVKLLVKSTRIMNHNRYNIQMSLYDIDNNLLETWKTGNGNQTISAAPALTVDVIEYARKWGNNLSDRNITQIS